MEGKLLYEGKAKQVFATEKESEILIYYKDDATAFDGKKKGSIMGKGAVNNRVSNYMFRKLEERGIPTHFIKELDERRTLARHVQILPIEVIVRNISAGSICARLGLEEGQVFDPYIMEFCYKSDELGDPFINESIVYTLKLATPQQVAQINKMTEAINYALKDIFLSVGLKLVDFKLEYGLYGDTVVLADEISPDTCRLWDAETNMKLDKDRFRRDMGGVEEAYQEIARRLLG